MKPAQLVAALCVVSTITCAQQPVYSARGKVLDARTQKGVTARISYASIPTGSISGAINDSTFEFEIFGTAKYRVTAQADGYNPATVIIDPSDLGGGVEVVRDIELFPSAETITLDRLIFGKGESYLDPASFPQLDEIAEMMKHNRDMQIQLEGHTDIAGSAKANLELSEKRVLAVKKYLVGKGIPRDRIKTRAFGSSRPLHEGQEASRALNRRVEMRILKY